MKTQLLKIHVRIVGSKLLMWLNHGSKVRFATTIAAAT